MFKPLKHSVNNHKHSVQTQRLNVFKPKIMSREIQKIRSRNSEKIIARSNAQAKTQNRQKWT